MLVGASRGCPRHNDCTIQSKRVAACNSLLPVEQLRSSNFQRRLKLRLETKKWRIQLLGRRTFWILMRKEELGNRKEQSFQRSKTVTTKLRPEKQKKTMKTDIRLKFIKRRWIWKIARRSKDVWRWWSSLMLNDIKTQLQMYKCLRKTLKFQFCGLVYNSISKVRVE